MRRQIPGLHSRSQDTEAGISGVFLVRVDRAWYRRHPQKPFVELRFVVLEPQSSVDRSFTSRLYCTERALWKLHWFLRDFRYDADLLHRDQVDERALLDLRGIVRTSHKTFRGCSYQDLDSFAPAGEWEALSCAATDELDPPKGCGDSDGL
jgi:hypothetical protein